MSYARWSDNSDVYVYPDFHGGITCSGCDIDPNYAYFSFNTDNLEHLAGHLMKHIYQGDNVPLNHIMDQALIDWVRGIIKPRS